MLRPPGTMSVVAGNNQGIRKLGWIQVRFIKKRRGAYNEFGVVKHLQIDMLIRGVFLRENQLQIMENASALDALGISVGFSDEPVDK